MSHVFPYNDFLGFTQEPDTRLSGSEIENIYEDFSSCLECESIADCGAHHLKCYGKLLTIPITKRMPPADWFKCVQAYLQILYNIYMGIPAFNYIYNANESCNNFVEILGTFEVISASGQNLILDSGGNDPRACTPGTWIDNPEWPLSGARWIGAGDENGSLQQFDFITFSNSPLESRGVITWIEELTYIDENSFSIKCPIPVDAADVAIDEENPCYVILHRRLSTRPLWDEPLESIPFRGDYAEENFEMSEIIELSGLMFHENYIVLIDNQNVTDQITDRILNENDITKIYFGSTNWNGETVEDLRLLGSSVSVKYYKYNPNSNCVLGQKICSNCRTTGRLNNWGSGTADHGLKTVYCLRRNENPSALSEFTDNCYQPSCSLFQIREFSTSNMGRSWLEGFFNNIWIAQDWYGKQAAAGTHTYYLYVKKHPSIMSLLGHFRLIAPTSYREKVFIVDNGIFRSFTNKGCLFNELYENLASYQYDTGKEYIENDIPAGLKGQIFSILANWQSLKNSYDWTQNSANYNDMLLPKFQKAGYRQEELDVSGIGETRYVRGGEIYDKIVFRFDRNAGIAYNRRMSTELIDDQLVVLINTGLPEDQEETVVAGTVHSATRIDANTIKIECELGNASLGKISGQCDEVINYCEGGNIVEMTDLMKPNNYYHNNVYGSNQKTRPGMSFHISLDEEKIFTIKNAYPCTGERLSYIPGSMTAASFIDLPYYGLLANQIPISIEAKRGTPPNAVMYRAILAYCPACDREEKFRNVGSNWVCQNCSYTTGTEPEITGRPPGMWRVGEPGVSSERALEMELEKDEYFYEGIFDENQELSENRIYFSNWILDHLDSGGSYEVKISLAGGGTIDYNPLTQADMDLEITEDQYNSIDEDDFYIGIWENEDVLLLSETDDADTRNWWDSETDGRFLFYKYIDAGKYWIRVHRDFLGMTAKALFPQSPLGGISSDEYYNLKIAGMPGLPANHSAWGCRADVLNIVDHGMIDDPSVFDNLSFTIKNRSIIHDDSEIVIETYKPGRIDFVTLLTSDFEIHHAAGMISINAFALPADNIFCLEIS
jgi:hypothetical protein